MTDRWSLLVVVVKVHRQEQWLELLYAFHDFVNRPDEWIWENTYELTLTDGAFGAN